jgi:hypothetical protein
LKIQPPEAQDTQWKLIDKDSGEVIETPGQVVESGVSVSPSGVEFWRPAGPIIQKEPWIKIPLPENIGLGLVLAMMGHASWNGILTVFDLFAENSGMSEMMIILLSYILMGLMVAGVLIVGTGLLHSVRAAPDGSEVDEYQAQLAALTQPDF